MQLASHVTSRRILIIEAFVFMGTDLKCSIRKKDLELQFSFAFLELSLMEAWIALELYLNLIILLLQIPIFS